MDIRSANLVPRRMVSGGRAQKGKMVSIWAWATDAVAIPDGPLDIAVPDLAALRG